MVGLAALGKRLAVGAEVLHSSRIMAMKSAGLLEIGLRLDHPITRQGRNRRC